MSNLDVWDDTQPWHYLHCRDGRADDLIAYMRADGWQRMTAVDGTVQFQSDNLLAVSDLRRIAAELGYTTTDPRS